MFPNCRKIEYSKLINYDEWVYSVPWGWLWQHVFQYHCLNRPHTYFLRHCYMGVTWQATKWIRSHLGTNKMVLYTTVVVGMWQTKTWRHPRGLNSDSGVFDLHFESQRETRNLRNHGVPFEYIIDEETEALEGEVPCLWELGCVGHSRKECLGVIFAPVCQKYCSRRRLHMMLLYMK